MLYLHSFTPSLLPSQDRAVVIGNFDGVHRGHQALLNELITVSRSHHWRATALILEPQPREFFHQQSGKTMENVPERILPLSTKISRLQEMGIDEVAIIHFRASVAKLSAESFVQEILTCRLHAKWVMTGEDFHFGQGRQGNTTMLRGLGEKYGFEFHTLPDIKDDLGVRLSSTLIRSWLNEGNFGLVNKALSANYQLTGRVAKGLGLARQWGIPTVNIYFRQKLAVSGVFAGRVELLNLASQPQLMGKSWDAVLHIGAPDSTRGYARFEKVEAHLLDFPNISLLGCRINITFLHKIRNSTPFIDEEKLKARIRQDREEVVAWHQESRLSSS